MRRLMYGVVLLAACMGLYGCTRPPAQPQGIEEGVYQIYYLNSSLTKLVPQEYQAKAGAGETDQLIKELMEQIRAVPQELDCQTALADKVGYQGYRHEEKVLYLDFDDNYTTMKPTREILCRAALVRTLTQVPGVEYISIYTADQPLMDAKNNPVGLMSTSDFVDNISNINSFEKTELTLFFADSTGEKLVKEKREVVHSISTSLEKLVVEQLIAGPGSAALSPTLPKDTKLLNVSVNDNVCYINFDSAFLSSTLEVKEYIPIYSIVNSLAEVTTINKVQIAVNGSQDVMFREFIPLNTLFERNLDYNADSTTGGTEN